VVAFIREYESWVKKLEDDAILRVRVSHQKGKDIPTKLFRKMLAQAGINEETFKENLK